MTSKTLVPVLLFLASPIASASGPVVIGPGAFSGTETVIDFESIAQNEQITTQFSALGVTFSGDLFGDTFNLFLFVNTDPGNVIACNFIDTTCRPPVGCSGSWTVDFSPPVTRVGFDAITNDLDDTTLTIFRSNVQTGSITFDTAVPDSFVGIEDSDGIDRVIVDAANNILGAICINNFRFEGGASLDIKPGSCPNSFNRSSHGVLPVALVGAKDFDVTEVDLSSLLLSRNDGEGGSVAPNEGPPGPHSVFADVATPFEGKEPCDCHDLDGDGILDLSMKFITDEMVEALQLDDLPAGDLVQLVVNGTLLDGTPFSASDCIRLVPPGTPPGMLAVGSNLSGVYIDVTPLDETLDGGGFTNFNRTFPLTSVVTLTARATQNGWTFVGWQITGPPQLSGPGGYAIGGVGDSAPDDELIPGTSIDLTVLGLIQTIEAVYEPPEFGGPPAPGVADRP